MTSPVLGVCADCGQPRKPDEIFCQCGAFLDYSASGEGRVNGKPAAAAEAAPNAEAQQNVDAESNERPPAYYQAPDERDEAKQQLFRVEKCWNCEQYNPSTVLVCLNCKKPTKKGEQVVEAEQARRRNWRRLLLLPEKKPLTAGVHEEEKEPFVSTDPKVLLRAGLIMAGVLLLLSALVLGAIKAWGPSTARVAHGYGWTREKLFPRFTPHHPSSVWPPKAKVNKKTGKAVPIPHPAADAFDRNLSTYWLSRTPRQEWDHLRVNFKPPVDQFTDVAVFAGDPTATTIVPRSLQFTFYRWEPHPDQHTDTCKGRIPSHFPERPSPGTFCVTGRPAIVQLLNQPTEQRFALGTHNDVAQIVVTVRGTHHSAVKKARAAITDIEFFDRH